MEGLLLQPRRIEVTHHALGTPKGPGEGSLRMVQLSDLHLHRLGGFERAIASRTTDLEPDVVLITGDAIDREDGLHLLDGFLEWLPKTASVIATLGNWEHWSDVDLRELSDVYFRHDARLLVNEMMHWTHGGRSIEIVGLDDLTGGAPNLTSAVEGFSFGPNVLVLAHSPAYRDQIPTGAVSPVAVLSGHTHGGQVALGSWAPMRPPGSGDYVSGWYRGTLPDLYVSRGLGTSIVPVRLGSVPEIACFDWFLAT